MADRSDDEPLLRGFLAARDTPCPVCSYNLRDLKSSVCPECAARLHLQVGSGNLHPGPWFLGVVSFALGLGFDGVVSLMMAVTGAIVAVQKGMPTIGQAWPAIRILATLITLGFACTVGLVLMFRRRAAWRRLALRRQWGAAATIFVVTGLVHAVAGAVLLGFMR